MEFSTGFQGREQKVVDLFRATFTASEGAAEGALIGGLVRRQMSDTAPEDIRVFTAWENGALIGGAVFTRLTYAHDPRTVFVLSPMAVATDRQGEGIGQALLRHALADLRMQGVDVAITYGAPAFYGRVGFLPPSDTTAPTTDHGPRPLAPHPPRGLDRPIAHRRGPGAAARPVHLRRGTEQPGLLVIGASVLQSRARRSRAPD
ncbi:Acetyltransferase (GNAT) domain-containing protein [Rhodovulum sp. ES.010]|uniref:GNAT family N-acetyltransferase n=1 Tax=Rhodovulum sp. ES.010 TaxID=1882821 RepID=UPI00092BEBCE|nr:GNAT family N-acetyltransferase [Rhodovulum sp. ES.010]SIO32335.1 Acetyltransferase (GNAT) domain-containing protein [Rhodovulum sp. ES.010]